MVGTLWIPGAERITPSAPGGLITSTAEPRVVWHTTEADPGTDAVWDAMIRVLKSKSAEPQVLYDPVTDRLGQFMPLNVSGRALKNDGTTRTNRVGQVCIQVEVIGRAAKPFTNTWKPGKNFRALWAAIKSHGIPDLQPSGVFPRFIADPPHNVPEDERSRAIWLGKGGHYAHAQIPGNIHGDPGGVSFPVMVAAGKPLPTTPTPAAPTEDDMSLEDVKAINDYTEKRLDDYFTWMAANVKQQLAPVVAGMNTDALAAAIVAKLPAGSVDQATVEAGVRAVLKEGTD